MNSFFLLLLTATNFQILFQMLTCYPIFVAFYNIFSSIKNNEFMTLYHYILMSQKDFLENQVIEEILRERAYSYGNQKKKDFWILIQPNFLKESSFQVAIQTTNFYKQQKKYIQDEFSKKDYFVALISSNKEFIKWFELRVGYFETFEKKDNTNYTSNGISGKLLFDGDHHIPFLKHSQQSLHPDILVKKYKQSLKEFS